MIVEMLAKAALGPVLGTIKDLYGKYRDGQISEQTLENEAYKALLVAFTGLWSTQASVIKAEIASDSWITKSWRPLMALSASFVLIIWYGWLVPIAVNWFGMPPLSVGAELLKWIYVLITISLTGYVAGRSMEKLKGK